MEKEKIMGDLFLTENEHDEAIAMMGKINALFGIWKAMPEIIDEHMVAAVLGFEEAQNEVIDKLTADGNRWWKWYQESDKKNDELEAKVSEMQRTIDRLNSLLRLEQEQIKATGNAVELKGMED